MFATIKTKGEWVKITGNADVLQLTYHSIMLLLSQINELWG